MSAERPWEDFADPVGNQPATTGAATGNDSGLDYEDIAKSGAAGVGRGVIGLAGTGGTIGDLARRGLGWAGVPESVINAGAAAVKAIPMTSVFAGPSAADIQGKLEETTGRKLYEPHSMAGQYASTIGEFAPAAFLPGAGSVTARVFNTLIPATASETAGQLTKGEAAEPWVRGAAGVLGGLAGGRIVTPAPPPTAARRAATAVLDREGVPLLAGERTGSNAVRWAEAVAGDMPLSSGAAQTRQQNQAAALDRAITRRVFDPVELERRGLPPGSALPQPDVMAHGRQSLSDAYTDLASRNQLRSTPTFQRELLAPLTEYERLALPSQRAGGARDIDAIRNDIVTAIVQGRGAMPGDVYQATRSRLGTLAEGAKNSDPTLANALRGVRGALDRGMQAGLSTQDAAAWTLTNQRWGNMKQIAPAVAAAGENLSPAKVAQSVRAGRAEQYARGAGDLDELTRAASTVIKPLPSSGTAQRTGWQQLFGLPGMLTAASSAGAGSALGPLGAVGGAMLPHLVGRAVMSDLGQRYLANQVAPTTTRGLLAQAIAQQAASQPSGIERNAAEQEAYRQKRERDLQKAGL